MKNNGTALILVFISTTFLMLFVTLMWKKSSLLLNLVNSKEKYYKNEQLTKIALDWSTKIVCSNFEYFLSAQKPIFLDFSFLVDDKDKQKISIFINRLKQSKTKIYMSSKLLDDENSILCMLSCILAINLNYSQGDKDSGEFVVQNYTVSNFI